MREKFSVSMSWIVGLSVFIGWMMIVGNPHVVETFIGIFFGIVSGLWVNNKITPWDE